MLCAENNMYVIDPTTPANMFHALRRQLHADYRKPLIVFTPKSLLRHPKCVSTIADFTQGGFKEIIDDGNTSATRLVFCTGKVYYDLLETKEKQGNDDVLHIAFLFLCPEIRISELSLRCGGRSRNQDFEVLSADYEKRKFTHIC